MAQFAEIAEIGETAEMTLKLSHGNQISQNPWLEQQNKKVSQPPPPPVPH